MLDLSEQPWEVALARQLLARHLQVSFPPLQAPPAWLPPPGTWLPADSEYALRLKARRRVVAVIGAGASVPVLPLGKELAEKLEREIGVHGEADYKAELIRLHRIYGLPAEDFETRLVALCRRPEDERKAREMISELCDIRAPSLLAYELIAHLLKHRYLDAVVSFNYDELLDQSLDDEVGKTEYVRIVSERDCNVPARDPDQPDYAPLYVKMHGTASERESLRFTREAYYRTPTKIVETVRALLDTENLVILNVGCRLASFDFQYLLREPRHVAIFNMSPDPLDAAVLGVIGDLRGTEKPEVKPIDCGADLAVDGFLPAAFERLVGALEVEATEETAGLAQWRSVGRHRVVSELLDADRVRLHTAEYLRQRTVLEVAFAAAKARGVASTTSLVDERCGRYYDLYRAAAREEDVTPATWPTVCAAGGLVESEDSSDVYYADASICVGKAPPPCRAQPATNHTMRAIDARQLAERVLTEIDASKWAREGRPRELAGQAERLARVIEDLRTHDELEIHSRDDRVCSKVFADPLVLPTHTAFRVWARKLVESEDYDEIRIVAETGGWLADSAARDRLLQLGERRIKLLVAFDMRRDALEEALPGRVEMIRIPWWRHNRHMRLLCKNGQPVYALYYARLLRTSMVTPVYLHDSADLRRLESAWDRLLQEGRDHEDRLRAHEVGGSGEVPAEHVAGVT